MCKIELAIKQIWVEGDLVFLISVYIGVCVFSTVVTNLVKDIWTSYRQLSNLL